MTARAATTGMSTSLSRHMIALEAVAYAMTIVSEAVFHVRKAKVTILTDLIENFEPAKVHKRWLRRLIALGRADGHTPLDLRMTFWPERKRVAEAAAKVLGWPTERLALAHGKVFDAGGGAVLRRELGWAAGARA